MSRFNLDVSANPFDDRYGGHNRDRDRSALIRIYEVLKKSEMQNAMPMPQYGGNGSMLQRQQVYHTMTEPFDIRPLIQYIEEHLGVRQPAPNKFEELEDEPKLWIVVDGGETFEGDSEQWANCYFSNVTKAGVEAFCRENNWKVEIEVIG